MALSSPIKGIVRTPREDPRVRRNAASLSSFTNMLGAGLSIVEGKITVDHDAAVNFVAAEHIDWTDTDEALTTTGIVTGLNFISTVATGTAPYACDSTTVNPNLNADLWDGNQFADYLDQAVKTTSSPTFVTGTFGTLVCAAGSITDSSGAISFGDENLSGTGFARFDGGLGIGADPTATYRLNVYSNVAADADSLFENYDYAGSARFLIGGRTGYRFNFGVYGPTNPTVAFRRAMVMASDSGMTGGVRFNAYGPTVFSLRGASATKWSFQQTIGAVEAAKIDFAGNFTSNVATGTAPYACLSMTVNANLNADMADGHHFDQDVLTSSSPTFVDVTTTKSKMTVGGGFAIKLTNKTGAASVAGKLVKTDPANDDAVALTAAGDTECIGVFLDAGIADGAEAWIVVAGIADVLFDNNHGPTRGEWVATGAAGYATSAASPAAAPTHFEEIGHCSETVAAGGAGTFVLARCVLHFN